MQGCKILKDHSNPAILLLIGKLSQISTHVPGFSHFLKVFLHHFVLAKLATSSIRVIFPGHVGIISLIRVVSEIFEEKIIVKI